MAKTVDDPRTRAQPARVPGAKAPADAPVADEATLTAARVLALQRGVGNAAVARYLQGGGDPGTLSRKAAAPSARRERRREHTEGVIFSEDGSNLHVGRSGRSRAIRKLTYKDRIFVVDRNAGGGWSLVTTTDGREGYVRKSVVKTDLPCPGAFLHWVPEDQTALRIAGRYFGKSQVAGRDGRYYVNVLAYVNPKALVEPKPRRWQDVQFKSRHFIYVPTTTFANSLKGKVDDGSITGGRWSKAWRAVKKVVNKAIGITVGAAAFVYGVLKGAVLTIKEILQGLGSIVGAIVNAFKKSFGEILGDVRGLYKEITGIDIRGVMGSLWKEFKGRWNADNPWDRWSFRGEVIGRVLTEVLLTVFSGGVAAILSGTSKFARLTAVVSRLRSVQKLEAAVRKNSPRLRNHLAKMRTKLRPKRPKNAAAVERRSREKNARKRNSGTPRPSTKGLRRFNPEQRRLCKARIDEAITRDKAYDIRVDQTQVAGSKSRAVLGPRLGNNRPDLQYTDAHGRRHIVEYDSYGSNRGRRHLRDALANDPKAIIELWQQVRTKRSGKWVMTYVKVFP